MGPRLQGANRLANCAEKHPFRKNFAARTVLVRRPVAYDQACDSLLRSQAADWSVLPISVPAV
jgi:hypothetical protein